MPSLKLICLSLRYSSWSMRPWLVLTRAGAAFETVTVELDDVRRQGDPADESGNLVTIEDSQLKERRALGSVHGLFPTLWIDSVPIHESLAICEYAAEAFPDAGLWPDGALARAQARAMSCEMATGFLAMRGELSCHLFGRVPGYSPSAAARKDISRIFEIWSECLDRSGGPFLFGEFGIADAMYFPVLTRFRTYGIAVPAPLLEYARSLEACPAVTELMKKSLTEPREPVYDDYMRDLGGDPDAALPA